MYDTICAAIERREWKYQKDEERLVINFGVNGDDIPMQFIMVVDAERQLVRMMSPLCLLKWQKTNVWKAQ